MLFNCELFAYELRNQYMSSVVLCSKTVCSGLNSVLKIHVYLEPQTMTSYENSTFTDVIKER